MSLHGFDLDKRNSRACWGAVLLAATVTTGAAKLAAQEQNGPAIPSAPIASGELVEEEQEPAERQSAAQEFEALPQNAIVVRGLKERKSSWKRLETDQAVIYSNGSTRDLKRVGDELERLDDLLDHLFKPAPSIFDRQKPIITLIGGANFVQRMRLETAHVQPSGFDEPFDTERFYLPSQERVLLAVGRRDQDIYTGDLFDDPFGDLADTNDPFGESEFDAFGSDDDGFFDDEFGSPGSTGPSFASPRTIGIPQDARRNPRDEPVERPWQTILYGSYVEHYLLTNMPAHYPRWYIDGLVAIFSSVGVRQDDVLEFGRTLPGFHRVLRSYPQLRSGPILSGAHLQNPKKSIWSPYHAWLMTHFFVLSNDRPIRREQFLTYLSQIGQGVPQVDAAKVFGDFAALDRELEDYRNGKIYYRLIELGDPPDVDYDPQRMSVAAAETLQLMVKQDSRLNPALTENREPDRRRVLDEHMGEVRATLASNPASVEARILLAEAECRAEMFAECLDATDGALAISPQHGDALSWRAVAMLGLAQEDPTKLGLARKAIVAANRADTEAVLPLIAYFRSYADFGEAVPELAMLGMIKAVGVIPAAPEPRLMLAKEFLKRGEKDSARKLLLPVLNASLESPERKEAEELLRQAMAQTSVG